MSTIVKPPVHKASPPFGRGPSGELRLHFAGVGFETYERLIRDPRADRDPDGV